MAKTAVGSTKNATNILQSTNSRIGSNAFILDKDGNVITNYTGNPAMDEMYKAEAEKLKAQGLKFNESENKLAKSSTIGNLALNAGTGILGLGQAIGGAKILKNIKAPKYPYEQLPNQQLVARLGDVQRLSQIGDPVIREKMMRDFVIEKAKQDAVAKVASGGDVSAYAAQSQANANRMNDNVRDIATSELAFKTQQGGILDNLIAKKMLEDAAIQKGRLDKFTNVDMPEFKAKRSYGEQLVNKGIGNLFNAGIGANQDAMVLKRTNQNDKLFAGQKAEDTANALDLRNQQKAMLNVDSGIVNKPNPVLPGATTGINLPSILPNYTQTVSGKNPIGIGVLGSLNKGDGSILKYGQAQPTATTVPTPTVTPQWSNPSYNKGDMAYMGTPQGYSQYLSKVAKLTPEQIIQPYSSTINPKTGQLYNINDVPEILKGMTDGKIADKHRMAQTLVTQYGY